MLLVVSNRDLLSQVCHGRFDTVRNSFVDQAIDVRFVKFQSLDSRPVYCGSNCVVVEREEEDENTSELADFFGPNCVLLHLSVLLLFLKLSIY